MMNWDRWIYRAGNLLADFPVEHACVLTKRRRFSMIHRRYIAVPLREIGVIVSRPARLHGLLLSSLTPPSNRDTPASRDLMDYGEWEVTGMDRGWKIGL